MKLNLDTNIKVNLQITKTELRTSISNSHITNIDMLSHKNILSTGLELCLCSQESSEGGGFQQRRRC